MANQTAKFLEQVEDTWWGSYLLDLPLPAANDDSAFTENMARHYGGIIAGFHAASKYVAPENQVAFLEEMSRAAHLHEDWVAVCKTPRPVT